MSVDKDLVSVQQARDLVEAAHRAQTQVAEFDQAKIDRICEAMAKAALREATRLGDFFLLEGTTNDLTEVSVAATGCAADGNLIPLFAMLIDAENADVTNMMMSTGVHAA